MMRCFTTILMVLVVGLVSLRAAEPSADEGPMAGFSQVLGRPTAQGASLSLLSSTDREVVVEYGPTGAPFAHRTAAVLMKGGVPAVIELGGLPADTTCDYRVCWRCPDGGEDPSGPTGSFQTQRAPGRTFTFGLQGDSHPERTGKMFNPDLYVETLRLVAKERPDFYVMLGDDFSLDRLIERQALTTARVEQVYARQRSFLGLMGGSSALYLVNGNHEQAGRHWLDGTPNNPAVLAGRARTRFFALPAPDGFYSGDMEEVPHVGFLRDYYAWTWGDALFVVMDPYWHSPVEVDHDGHGKRGNKQRDTPASAASSPPAQRRDPWQATIGDAQYQWLRDTLLTSKARYKFVFAHHVLGTGRGGIEEAGLYEWGGKDRKGVSLFATKRPTWEMPIHQLFVKAGVTIFFQGHDHLFARQDLDGVIYQSTPNPADDTYQVFNREAYTSGTVLPNSGHLRVTVSPHRVQVEYVRSFLASDSNPDHRTGMVAFSYVVQPPARARAQDR